MLAPVIVETDLESGANARLQARSPARSIQSNLNPATGIAAGSVQDSESTGTEVRSEGERETAFERGSRDEKQGERPARLATSSKQGEQTITPITEDERRGSTDWRPGEHPINGGGNPGERRMPVDRGSKSGETGEQSQRRRGSRNMGGRPGQLNPASNAPPTLYPQMIENTESAKSPPDYTISGGGLAGEQASQWLKTVLPEASGGWWDVYQKDNGFAVKFRWRDRGRQTLTFPRISHQHLQDLRRSAPDEIGRIMRERISASLLRFLIDPGKRDKAILVAQKLGISPDDLQKFTIAK
jgi:hypothetical protein